VYLGIGTTGNAAALVPDITSIAIDPVTPTTLYAGTQDTASSGVLKSTNGGSTWTVAATGLPLYQSVTAVAVDPLTPSTVYVGTATAGVYASTDSAGSWAPVTGTPQSVTSLTATVLSTSQLPASSLVAGPAPRLASASSVIAIGEDTGDYLDLLLNGQPAKYYLSSAQVDCENSLRFYMAVISNFRQVADDPLKIWLDCISPDAKLVGTNTVYTNGYTVTFPPAGSGLVSAGPEGTTADVVNTPWSEPDGDANEATSCSPFNQIVPSPTDPTSFYVGAGCGVLHGTGDGQQLVRMSAGLPVNLTISAMAIAPSGATVYAGAVTGGVYAFTLDEIFANGFE